MAVLIGTFETQDAVDTAIVRLREAGFADADMSVVSRPGEAVEAPPDPEQRGHHAVDAAAIGAGVGVIVGGALLGPVGALLGAAAGGGSLAALLMSRGVAQRDAQEYERRLEAGRYVLAVEAGDRTGVADSILTTSGAERIDVER